MLTANSKIVPSFFFFGVIFPFFLLRIHYAVESLNWNRQFWGEGKNAAIPFRCLAVSGHLDFERKEKNVISRRKIRKKTNGIGQKILDLFFQFSWEILVLRASFLQFQKEKRSSWEGVVNISSFSRQPFFFFIFKRKKKETWKERREVQRPHDLQWCTRMTGGENELRRFFEH